MIPNDFANQESYLMVQSIIIREDLLGGGWSTKIIHVFVPENSKMNKFEK